MPFEKIETGIEGLIIIKSKKFFDNRGYFQEIFKDSDFKEMGIELDFSQDNLSFSKKGVIRGLHYQKAPYGQAKLVKCVYGSIFDAVVDVRRDSKTFGKYFTVILHDSDDYLLFVPDGFLHGFCVLSDFALVLYKTSSEYSPKNSSGVIYNDQFLSIPWPVENPIISPQDAGLKSFKEEFLE
ncbi:dTDP-4-dehydrorhamnose 3,5-epimerase [Thermodesulfobium narugense DSM 14796]|uniref:dTDP-4-dehydrorhamnose 3,5-epimerase n=1 Tax=Thermodesulfobium narugense DSM 14796 TaxID=747365 RepID=M1E6H8_9BACT|nr:dTDP-4-dehydrorhamnose 3,5-epimerase [Thermodesulfobium narugense]AEE14806.1 dTDP-4-dehydrorhamnose 3,5-epimerase [Thermodesulfobium narugense DSM 14796]